MNSKITTNSQLSTPEPKKQKLSRQLEQEQNQRNGDHRGGFKRGGRGGEWGKGTGIKKHNRQAQNRQAEVKNSIGNGEAKEFICTSHRHELRRGKMLGWGGCREKGDKEEKNIGTTVIA